MRILVIGSMNMDVVNRVSSHPKPGETIHSLHLSHHPGGKGANQAIAAARSGAEVQMLAAVGSDEYAHTLTAELTANEVDGSSVKKIGGPTGTAFITINNEGENSIIVAAGANGQLSGKDVKDFVKSKGLNEVDTFIVQNEIPIETTLAAMKAAKEAGVRVIFNPAPVGGVSLEMVKYADVIVLNETEAAALTDVDVLEKNGIENAIQILMGAGAGAAIVTLGREGAVFGDGQVTLRTKAFSVSTVDTTAAGDTFVGAFASVYESAKEAEKALRYASAAAALAVTKEGAQPSIPMKEDVLRFLEEKTRP